MTEFMANPYVSFLGWLFTIIGFFWGLFQHKKANKLKAELKIFQEINNSNSDSHNNFSVQDKATYVDKNDGIMNINNN